MTSPQIRRPGQKEPTRTWRWGLDLLRNQAAIANRVPGQLTRDQAAAVIVQAMKLAPQVGHPFTRWYELALPTLGYYKPGDKFRVDAEWRGGMNDPAANELLWREMEVLVKELDGAGVPFTMPDTTANEGKFKALARLAWDRMQRDQGIVPPNPKVPRPPGMPAKPPITPPKPTLPLPDLRGALPLLLVLGGLYYLSKKGR